MNADVKAKIERAIASVAKADESTEYGVAESVLRVQTSDVVFHLAIAALVDAARRKRRAAALEVERAAEMPAQMHEGTAAFGKRPRKGTREWRVWAETDEGRSTLQREAEIDEQATARMFQSLGSILDDYAADLRIKWTDELLATEFGLPDGTRTTWGAATVGQHRERMEMFAMNAQANLEGAARHKKAIEELEASGAPSLSALLMASA